MAEAEDRESGVNLAVPHAVEVRWPAYEALPADLRPTADLLAEGLSDEIIAARLGRPLATVQADVSLVFARLSVGGRWEIARLRRSEVRRAG
jgi:DNA-binding NarL/FixJ family response regulator